jgi:hypothetical protein
MKHDRASILSDGYRFISLGGNVSRPGPMGTRVGERVAQAHFVED